MDPTIQGLIWRVITLLAVIALLAMIVKGWHYQYSTKHQIIVSVLAFLVMINCLALFFSSIGLVMDLLTSGGLVFIMVTKICHIHVLKGLRKLDMLGRGW